MLKELIAELIRKSRRFASARGISAAFQEVEILAALIAASFYGHRSMNLFTKFIIILCLIYVIFPFDIIPDVIPMFGYADDIMLVRYLISQLNTELTAFRTWRQANPEVDVYSPPTATASGGGGGGARSRNNPQQRDN